MDLTPTNMFHADPKILFDSINDSIRLTLTCNLLGKLTDGRQSRETVSVLLDNCLAGRGRVLGPHPCISAHAGLVTSPCNGLMWYREIDAAFRL